MHDENDVPIEQSNKENQISKNAANESNRSDKNDVTPKVVYTVKSGSGYVSPRFNSDWHHRVTKAIDKKSTT